MQRKIILVEGSSEWSRLPRTSEAVFPVTAEGLRYHWEQALARAGITDLRFHDLRHEAISRLFELGLSVPEVALISGHKTISALQTYANMKPMQVGQKLRRLVHTG
ncbi:tyrosine-type recombinase/integrase [Limibaculum sp. FT325]|uniref:tyrosine-type recombinase/integrase n=1 Tax=Thermohalobaculum sediminis TaxID=2939436 RepID=UPI0020BF44CC|nr:tyrosine-type recombinase/integrase [Limibaculum sediminis]MCL5777210.1 tyrosine-type recombinase/integrase [Limibaculum sediminis]